MCCGDVTEVVVSCLGRYVVPGLGIYFVDREREVRYVLDWVLRGVSWNYVVYGPWGCGKTEFARAVTYAVEELNDFVFLYVDLTQSELHQAIYARYGVKELLLELVQRVCEDLLKFPLKVFALLRKLCEVYKLVGRYLVIFMDEVTRSLDRYRISIRDYVSALDKAIHEWRRELGLRNIVTVLLTSELSLIQYFRREVGKTLSIYEMWNLSKSAFMRLLEEVKCPLDYEILWRLCGGNPRLIYELRNVYAWDVERWLEREIVRCWSLYSMIRRSDVLLKYLRSVVEEIDSLAPIPITEELKQQLPEVALTQELLRQNMVIPLEPTNHLLSEVPREEWIGREWAWQVPLYYYIFRAILEKEQKPTSETILREVST
ncbi:MAG: hypothetical protein DRJ40_01660 [Thermoprotei archaeon]|nr:MAG: hypothetical protein DRJ40_01660 [Thermoprotei archaeon]